MKHLTAALAFLATPAAAQIVLPCDDLALADAIVEPWEDHTRTFANGAVRVALIDTIEPALGAYYLMVLSPPYDELGARLCQMIGFDEGFGFTNLEFATLSAEYVPSRGLEFQIMGRIAAPEYDFTNAARLWLTLNQTTGEIATFMELGNE